MYLGLNWLSYFHFSINNTDPFVVEPINIFGYIQNQVGNRRKSELIDHFVLE
ncbi:hypothetical protein PB1A_0914 [Leuconostoc inhae]|uniref:Uncharacterized protein n=1 Tax=Leuconostoc inhae TaxID=178001 RepID=A0AAN2QTV8_9LACO|nr:hypothetical protein LEGAS_0068 [Leuconostoc gasicomitatum LMG 18811]CUW03985.1 hypothetical protein PL111_1791 [Leuconostoc inhae]CUW04723.1 hypothetical protein PB1A_0914 [Leuconostoc inhae]CUW18342.1 hypothetical protein C120C_1028 [Leuconostoc inhae]CUW20729.1 hypothetical protein KSL4_1897 [Leuconostoc inhae]